MMAARFGGLNWQLRPDSNHSQMVLRTILQNTSCPADPLAGSALENMNRSPGWAIE